jgi:ribosomal protein S18 acetylase RimI-like enzyme
MTFIIKKLETSDWQAYRDIRLEYLTLHPEAFGSDFATENIRTESEWRAALEGSTLFAGVVNGSIVGTVGFFILNPEKMRHRGTLFGMYVKREGRRSGLADALVQQVIDHARGKVLQIHCTVVTSNATAANLYKRHGFTTYGTEPRALKCGKKFYDEALMVKILA